jgi:hypothetical protein
LAVLLVHHRDPTVDEGHKAAAAAKSAARAAWALVAATLVLVVVEILRF